MAGADMYDRLRSENGKKTEKARNALISLIRDRKLQPGDKLPNQKELIQDFPQPRSCAQSMH